MSVCAGLCLVASALVPCSCCRACEPGVLYEQQVVHCMMACVTACGDVCDSVVLQQHVDCFASVLSVLSHLCLVCFHAVVSAISVALDGNRRATCHRLFVCSRLRSSEPWRKSWLTILIRSFFLYYTHPF